MIELDKIKNEILKTEYLEDVTIGNYFHMKYKDLYNTIIKVTECLEKTYKVNLLFRSRVLFLIKYDCNLSKINKNGRFLTFDRKSDDFIEKSSNSAKSGWDKIKNNLNTEGIYTLDIVVNLLKNIPDSEIFGKSKNRVINKKDPKLYNSIIHYSKDLNIFDRNSNKLPSKIIFIRDYNSDIKKLLCCSCNNNYVYYNHTINNFNKICKKCYYNSDDFYPQIGYFKKKYGEKWEDFYNQDRLKIKNKKVNSFEWFKDKYGKDEGTIKYLKDSNKRVENIINLSINSYSKISQELFWLIYNDLSDNEKINCFFKELNKEVFIHNDNKFYIPDFVYKDKIIEYDGQYWHDKNKDKERDSFYFKNGYKLLKISDNDFNRQKKPKEIIIKCVNFLRDEEK